MVEERVNVIQAKLLLLSKHHELLGTLVAPVVSISVPNVGIVVYYSLSGVLDSLSQVLGQVSSELDFGKLGLLCDIAQGFDVSHIFNPVVSYLVMDIYLNVAQKISQIEFGSLENVKLQVVFEQGDVLVVELSTVLNQQVDLVVVVQCLSDEGAQQDGPEKDLAVGLQHRCLLFFWFGFLGLRH